jgi:AcrR family transcriptional regulator
MVSGIDIVGSTMTATPASGRPAARRRGRPPSGGREAILVAARDLLRERGASKLTTREVAARAGVSEGSVFYHFTDRTGLLTAVIEEGLRPLHALHGNGIAGESVRDGLDRFSAAVDGFLDHALVVMIAAQSDAELRDGLAGYLLGQDLGPHRGVQALADYLRAEQAAGTIRSDVDPTAIAFLVVSSCFLRVGQRQMIAETYGRELSGRDDVTDALVTLLQPPDPPARP